MLPLQCRSVQMLVRCNSLSGSSAGAQHRLSGKNQKKKYIKQVATQTRSEEPRGRAEAAGTPDATRGY